MEKKLQHVFFLFRLAKCDSLEFKPMCCLGLKRKKETTWAELKDQRGCSRSHAGKKKRKGGRRSCTGSWPTRVILKGELKKERGGLPGGLTRTEKEKEGGRRTLFHQSPLPHFIFSICLHTLTMVAYKLEFGVSKLFFMSD